MDRLKEQKIKAISEVIKKIYKNHELPYYPQSIEWTAEIILDKLKEVEIMEFERQYEANLLSQDIPSLWERENGIS